jgi:hypothetical protein
MNCELLNTLECSNAYRAFVLNLTAVKDNATDTTLEQLAMLLKEKYLTVRDLPEALKNTGLVLISTEYKPGEDGAVKRNTYVFKQGF